MRGDFCGVMKSFNGSRPLAVLRAERNGPIRNGFWSSGRYQGWTPDQDGPSSESWV